MLDPQQLESKTKMTLQSPFHFIVLRLLLLIFGAKGTQQTNRNPSNSSCGFRIHLCYLSWKQSLVLFQNAVKDEILILNSIAFYYSSQKNKYFCRTFCFEINIVQILSLFAKPFYHSWFPCLIEFYSLLSFPSFCKDRFIASEIGMMHQASS